MAIEEIRRALTATEDEDLTPVVDPNGHSSVAGRRLVIAIQDANQQVLVASQQPSRSGMGSTVAVVLFDAVYDVAAIAHVGDSRVYRVRGDAIEQLTVDHTMVEQWVREGRIGRTEAETSPHRHMITQAIGTQDVVRPTLRLERPEPGDVFVLTSDGVHDVVRPESIVQAVREAPTDLAQACTRLIALANERGGRDNSTVVLVRCLEPETTALGGADDETTVGV
jgi:protein phosphatase